MRPLPLFASCVLTLGSMFVPRAAAQEAPLVEPYLREGRLADGEQKLAERLAAQPEDDEARFGLGVIQFLRAFENLGASLYQHGLRTERAFPGVARVTRQFVPQNPSPQELTYLAARRVVERLVADLERAEATLAKIKNPEVKLPLRVAEIKLDLCGLGTPIHAAFVLGRLESPQAAEAARDFVVAFDRGDVHWLRGYCHFLCALGDMALAVDARELFNAAAHLVFEKPATPHAFLLEENRDLERAWFWNTRLASDLIATIHLTAFPVTEPERMRSAHEHLLQMLENSRQMWTHYAAETDDDREWIPNPRQTGVLRVSVSEEMIAAWLRTVDEAERVLLGKSLLPFWRGENPRRGVNLRRVFLGPRRLDPILWIQGTAATPYLEEGEITRLATPQTLRELSGTFGGNNFFGFAFWFN